MNAELKSKLLEHSKEAHFFQLAERDKIGSQIAFCFAGLGLIASTIVFYLNDPPSVTSLIAIVYWLLLGVAALFGIIAVGCFIHVLGLFTPNKYMVLQSPRTIVSEIKNLSPQALTEADKTALDSAFTERLTELYADAATINEFENERRKLLLRRIQCLSIISLLLLFVNSLPFFYVKLTAKTAAQAVEIIKPIKVEYERTEGHR